MRDARDEVIPNGEGIPVGDLGDHADDQQSQPGKGSDPREDGVGNPAGDGETVSHNDQSPRASELVVIIHSRVGGRERVHLGGNQDISGSKRIRRVWYAADRASGRNGVRDVGAEWEGARRVPGHGTFYCTREVLKLMAPQGSGAIVNMGSIMGTAGGAGGAAYCAARAGILGFTRSVAREVVTRNIRVNAIAPGYIETDMTAGLGDLRAGIEAQTPMRRMGEPDDIAWAAVYLASDEAKFVTGQVVSPNGGWHMSQ